MGTRQGSRLVSSTAASGAIPLEAGLQCASPTRPCARDPP